MNYIDRKTACRTVQRVAAGALLCIGALVTAEAWAGCRLGDGRALAFNNSVYFPEPYQAGDEIKGWQSVTIRYLVDCDPDEPVELTYAGPDEGYFGEIDGRHTFRTSDSDIGVQITYQALDGSSEKYMDDMGGRSTGTAIWNNAESVWDYRVQFWYRYVAINGFAGSGHVQDTTLVHARAKLPAIGNLGSIEAFGFMVEPKTDPYCTFSSEPPKYLTVPTTGVGELSREGDTGAAAGFSFGWRCVDGNPDPSPGGDFRFKFNKAASGKPGHIEATGDAKGVDLRVTITNPKTGRVEPIRPDWWYSDGGALPQNGTADMEVQFIRNGDATLTPGKASGRLTIEVLKY